MFGSGYGDCPLCGAADCLCSCLEELQAFNKGRRDFPPVEREMSKPKELEIGDNLGCVLMMLIGGLTFLGIIGLCLR